ncbi:MAG: hypothetical protein AB7H97_13115 [Pseudobdellovibrionaceae bacterium]
MRFSFLISILLFSNSIFANTVDSGKEEGVAVNLKCVTEMPTTSYLASTEGEKVKVTMIHHNGTKYMPIYSGNLTPSDIPEMQKRSEILQKLGERVEIVFEKKNCNRYGAGLYSCGMGQIESKSGIKVESVGLLTRVSTDRLYDIVFEKNTVSLTVYIDGRNYSIDNDFYFNTCRFE